MDGVHDLGGMHGFGPVVREANEPVFHAPWEATVVAMMRSARAYGLFNIDEFRHAIERMPPDRYLSSTYYERWLDAVTRLCVEKGLTTPDELETAAARKDQRPRRRSRAKRIDVVSPTTSFRQAAGTPRFRAGDRVTTITTHTKGHTRLPRYARGRRGTVHAFRGFHVFPDTSAHGLGENPQPLYSVGFESAELWGEERETSNAGQTVYLDLWESYLLPGS